MAAIRKRGDNWQVQVRRLGQPPVTRTFLLKTNALEWARLMETKADRNDLPPSTKILNTMSLGQLVQRYLEEIVPQKKGRQIECITLNAFLREPMCRKKLSAITAGDFNAYKERRLAGISPKSLDRQLAPISNMFQIARIKWEIPIQNPLGGIHLDATGNRRQRRLREGELDGLLKATSKNRNPLIKPIILLALETAMRRGEILDLRFHDVDIERCTATIREAKNGHSRTIPLSSLAVALLETTIAVMSDKAKGQNERVFPLTPVAVRLAWDRLTKRAKIEDLHFHDLRHEAISRFFEKGLTVPEAASISGHRDIRMLLRYAHADREKLVRKLDD